MKARNNISEVMDKVKKFIYAKNLIALKFAYFGDISFAQNQIALHEEHKLDKKQFGTFVKSFGISAETFRSFDKTTRVNGKKVWISQLAIKQMIEDGELLKCDSYKHTSVGGYCKSYVLEPQKLEEIALDKSLGQLSDSFYDDVRELIDAVQLDVYKYDKNPLCRKAVKVEWDEEAGFLDAEDQLNIKTLDSREWLLNFYTEEELSRLERTFKTSSCLL